MSHFLQEIPKQLFTLHMTQAVKACVWHMQIGVQSIIDALQVRLYATSLISLKVFAWSSDHLQTFRVGMCCKPLDDGLFDVLSHLQRATLCKASLVIFRNSPLGLKGDRSI